MVRLHRATFGHSGGVRSFPHLERNRPEDILGANITVKLASRKPEDITAAVDRAVDYMISEVHEGVSHVFGYKTQAVEIHGLTVLERSYEVQGRMYRQKEREMLPEQQ